MKIVSWNVNGIRACAKRGMIDFLQQQDPDIFCIQETKAHPDQVESELKTPLNRLSYWSSAERKGYSGTATYTRQPAQEIYEGIGIHKFDAEGRFVVSKHKSFWLFNVYFPNGSASLERHVFKQEFLKRFTIYLGKLLSRGEQVIVVGDYNVAYMDIDVFDPVGLSVVSGFLPEERQWFEGFLQEGFVDTFRYVNPTEKGRYTWWSYQENGRAMNRGWRIDHICVSKGLENKILDAQILEGQLGSDHCPVLVELKDF